MKLLEKMKFDLSSLWKRAVKTEGREERANLFARYRVKYQAYKKQRKFLAAMKESMKESMKAKTKNKSLRSQIRYSEI